MDLEKSELDQLNGMNVSKKKVVCVRRKMRK